MQEWFPLPLLCAESLCSCSFRDGSCRCWLTILIFFSQYWFLINICSWIRQRPLWKGQQNGEARFSPQLSQQNSLQCVVDALSTWGTGGDCGSVSVTEGKGRNEHFLGDDWTELSPECSRSSQSPARLMLGCAIDQQEEQRPLLELGKEGTRNVNQTGFLSCVDDGRTRSCGGM